MTKVMASKEENYKHVALANPTTNGVSDEFDNNIVVSFKPFGEMYSNNIIE